ncbi:APC membrane recruitment protein 2 [Rhinichthys klamathensis goyatoka]|uniref:APC membrane recruitment protein 2 n=1 Tax=Rhinichthys klamathensis goyatoka TaxID=3034132 RepID=UPI0024B5B54A|nr:APC membrane recruitment protein 2 [Rhinichthys klamathensis goyatoka]
MEVQNECSEPPPCDPQPPGKLNKAAFKLFGKRKSGSSMPSIFSVRNKGESTGKAAGKTLELVRSKTHDGLITDTPSELDGHRKEESASSDQLHAGTPDGVSNAPLRSSITKSFSFFSLLRRSSSRAGDGTTTVGRRGRGLKGLFSSMRWRRKPQVQEDSLEVAKEVKEGDLILSSSSGSVETEKDMTLTLEPLPQVFEKTPLPGDAEKWKATSMQELQGTNEVECGYSSPPLSRQHTVTEESPTPSPVRVQTGGLQHDKHSASELLSSIPTCALTPPMEHSTADPQSEQSVDRLCSMFTDVTSLKSFDSLTGCGDIIADPEEDSGNGGSATSSGTGSSSGGCMGRRLSGAGTNSERCSPAKPPLPPQVSSLTSIHASCYIPAHQRPRAAPKKPQGSGVVAYMGGGEEMASPEGVDDADMQGLWHMLPQKVEDSPALRRTEPVLHHAPTRLEKRPPQVKALGLSKIPVSGVCKMGKQQPSRPSPPPVDKELQDAPPSDEGYWDSPTPGPEDEDSTFLRRDGLLKDSCSGDALYDLYDPDSPSAAGSDDDVSSPTKSAGDLKTNLPSPKFSSSVTSSFRSMKGSTSLPRDSKIPISVRQTPPSHSSSQGALSSNLSPTSTTPPKKTDAPPRTRIPVSKVPVRRSGNKSTPTSQSRK